MIRIPYRATSLASPSVSPLMAASGVVDEHIDRAPFALELAHHLRGSRNVEHRDSKSFGIAAGRTHNLQRLRGALLVAGVTERDSRASLGKRSHDRTAEAA